MFFHIIIIIVTIIIIFTLLDIHHTINMEFQVDNDHGVIKLRAN